MTVLIGNYVKFKMAHIPRGKEYKYKEDFEAKLVPAEEEANKLRSFDMNNVTKV
jgi:hypothetical protein